MNLDSLFLLPSSVEDKGSTLDVSGLIGQYAHGNEPSHLVVYLYALEGKLQKTNNLINQVMNTLYNNTPDGLCGNEDCGQMSAWYIFSAIGIYPDIPRMGIMYLVRLRLRKQHLILVMGIIL